MENTLIERNPGKEARRDRWNLTMFIISYVLNNLVSGVLYDTYVNYLQEVSVSIATSFWAFYGYATFISAAVLLLVPKTGYKKLLLFCAVACTSALFCVVYLDWQFMLYATTLLALTGVQLHYIMLAPYVAAYTASAGKNNIDWYTRTYYMGYIGYFLTTYLGGVFVVKMFSLRAGVTYEAAKELTAYIADVSPALKSAYIQGNEDVLVVTGILAALCIVPVLLIREKKEDYASVAAEAEKDHRSLTEKGRDVLAVLFRKDAAIYLGYWTIISFAMGLFTSYYTVFLNRNLHIDKATSSLLVSISYAAIVLFMLFTPMVVKKLGTVGTICFTVIGSVPFMLMIANGDAFGGAMIPAVGFALFMRAGLANLGSPAESALSMSVVPASLRPAYTSLVNFLAGFVSILSGTFTGKILFVTQEGYRTAYYIAAVLYLLAACLLFFGLRKYKRTAEVAGEEAQP